MFLEYIGKTPSDYGLQLARIWSDENKSRQLVEMNIVIETVVNI